MQSHYRRPVRRWVTMVLLLPTIAQAGVFLDIFEDNNLGAWAIDVSQLEKGAVRIEDGTLQLSPNTPNEPIVAGIQVDPKWQPNTWEDYQLEFDFMIARIFPGAGVDFVGPRFRIYTLLQLDGVAPVNFHQAIITPGGVVRWRSLVGQEHGVAHAEISERTWYSVQIAHRDGNHRLWWRDSEWNEGMLLLEFADDTWSTGGIRFDSVSCDVLLDNIRVSGENVPDIEFLAVESTAKLAALWGALKRPR